MKSMYFVALGVFTFGLVLLIYSVANEGEMNLLGLVLHSRITKGLGVITMIFSVITFLAVYGGLGTEPPQEKPRG
ncbi:MAG: hypothetical protein HOP18_17165 [Deltaproteobacteria bacterium]|nr:hypothetical protein [Deltaproteobacteria bacterium]